jgi:hypothetical protein
MRTKTEEQKKASLAQVRARRLANLDAVKAREKAWREKNKAKIAAKQKNYIAKVSAAKHADPAYQAAVAARLQRAEEKRKLAEARASRVPMTPEQQAAYRADYRLKNKETLAAKARVRYAEHKAKCESDQVYRAAVLAKQKAQDKAERAEFRQFLNDRKPACIKCGLTKPKSALGFHHRDCTTKSFNVSQARGLGKQRILGEIAKCDVLCFRCHAALHEHDLLSFAAVLASLAHAS